MRVFGPDGRLCAFARRRRSAAAQESPGILPCRRNRTRKQNLRTAAKAAKPVAPKISAPATVAAKTAAVTSETIKLESSIDPELSAGERLKIQSALLWSGDYTGSINGG